MGPAVVLARGGGYDMCDTYRGTDDYRDGADAYRSGYADSVESQTWTRDDGCAGIASPLDSGAWEATMLTYASVVDPEAGRYRFHDGNGFGPTGVGVARWNSPHSSGMRITNPQPPRPKPAR